MPAGWSFLRFPLRFIWLREFQRAVLEPEPTCEDGDASHQTRHRPRGYRKDTLTLFCGTTKTCELIPEGGTTKAIRFSFNLGMFTESPLSLRTPRCSRMGGRADAFRNETLTQRFRHQACKSRQLNAPLKLHFKSGSYWSTSPQTV